MITVRVIDARNGKPWPKLVVPISLLRATPTSKGFRSLAEARANFLATVRETTDAKGEVSFTLPSPPPGVISVDLVAFGCGRGTFDAKEVVERGVVGENVCKTKLRKMNLKFEAKPGEIVYFAAPISFWEGVFR